MKGMEATPALETPDGVKNVAITAQSRQQCMVNQCNAGPAQASDCSAALGQKATVSSPTLLVHHGKQRSALIATHLP